MEKCNQTLTTKKFFEKKFSEIKFLHWKSPVEKNPGNKVLPSETLFFFGSLKSPFTAESGRKQMMHDVYNHGKNLILKTPVGIFNMEMHENV